MLILIGTILGTYFFLLGLSGFFTLGIPTMALTYLLLAFMHRFVKKIEVRVFWAFLFSFLITVLTYLLFTFTHSLAKGKFEADSLIVIANGALISALAVGIGNIFYAYASKVLADGQVLNQELLSVVNSARNNLWAYQKTIARVLHGNVQARLQAATLKLAKSENSEEVLTEIRKDLSGAIGAVQSPLGNSNKSLSESLIELIDLWSYACRIEVDIPDSIYARFADKSFATECALEVINEAITNAVKHGGAESVSIKATEVKQELVEFNIRNPRTKQSAIVGSGLGSKILEEATQAFTIKESESEYLLTASIFVGN
jgi:signal transduction histidine kinase